MNVYTHTFCPGSHHDFSHDTVLYYRTADRCGRERVGGIIDLPDKITLLSTPSMGTVTVHSKKGDEKKSTVEKVH
jgi:hypothetical protein